MGLMGCGVCSSFQRRGAWLGRLFLCVFALVGRVKGLRYCAALAVRSVCALVARPL